MKFYLSLLLSFCSIGTLSAQKENNVWAFGDSLSLVFGSTDIPLLSHTAMSTLESGASVCDSAGNLLFYSNGHTVWDKNHTGMPNGSGLLGNSGTSSYQGVAIVRQYNSSRYYLFVGDAVESIRAGEMGYLRYSVIDMSLNGGLGDIIASEKNIIADSLVGEMLTEIEGAGCYTWLVVHHPDSAIFHAFKIDASGLDLIPVVSRSGETVVDTTSGNPYCQAYMKGAPGGNFIANFASTDVGEYLYELHSFDHKTGRVSGGFVFSDKCWGAMEFSPDSKLLYTGEKDGIYQYNLSLLPDIALFKASALKIAPHTGMYTSDLRRGTDKKIYILDRNNRISRINQPNRPGTACDVQANIITLPVFKSTYYLGTPVIVPGRDTFYAITDTLDCQSDTITLSAREANRYQWSTGDTGRQVRTTESTTLWVHSYAACKNYRDSFKIRLPKLKPRLRDTVTCNGKTVLLDAALPGEVAAYTWQDGSSASTFAIQKPGTYFVNIRSEGCSMTDTVQVRDGSFSFDFGTASLVACLEDSTRLVPGIEHASYLWQDGSTQNFLPVRASGKYWLTISKGACMATDTILVRKEKCKSCLDMPNAFTPNGDTQNDLLKPFISCPVLDYRCKIYNRYGQLAFSTNDPASGWDGTIQGREANVGVYYYLIEVSFGKPESARRLFKGDISLLR